MPTVRPAGLDDGPAIAAVHVETWRHAYRGLIADAYLDALTVPARAVRWAEILQDPQSITLVGLDDAGAVVGFASGGAERTGDAAFTGELYALYVRPQAQAMGLGRALTLAMAEALQARGHRAMLLWTLTENPARGYYERLGGRVVRETLTTIGEQVLPEVGYGWPSIAEMLARHGAPKVDGLTGLPDVRSAFTRLEAGPAAAVWVDVDGLVYTNDMAGFRAGDEALIRLAAWLRPLAEAAGATLYRVRGDEFALIWPGAADAATLAAAAALAEAIVADAPAGIGVALHHPARAEQHVTASALAFRADATLVTDRHAVCEALSQALYELKLSAGRNAAVAGTAAVTPPASAAAPPSERPCSPPRTGPSS